MKKIFIFLVCLAGASLFYYQTNQMNRTTAPAHLPTQSDPPDQCASLRNITDMKGRQIQVKQPLERVALLGGPTGQVAFILGVQDKLCAVTNTLKMSQLVREIYPRIKDLPGPRTTCGNIQIETLITSAPDLVIAGDIDGQIVMDKTRIPVAVLDDSMGEGIADIKREIEFYGYVLGQPERARAYGKFLERISTLVTQRTQGIPESKKKTVFQGFGPSHLVTLGGDTFMEERIRMAGCRNAAASVTTIGKQTGLHSGLGEVSMEQVLAWDPDILVVNFGNLKALRTHPQWEHIKAVKTGKVYHQPAGVFLFNRPTAESAAIYPLWLAGIAHPDRFKDVNIPGLVQEFYRDILEFDLSPSQVEDILSGVYESRLMEGIRRQKS